MAKLRLPCQILTALFLFGLSITGCRAKASPTPIETAVAQTTITFESPTLTPSATSSATATFVPTPPPSPSASPTLTRTPITPVPTLPATEQDTYLLNLIETNGGCELPCFLGIQPGVSSWEDIRPVESPIYFRESYFPKRKDERLYLYVPPRKTRYLDVTFWGSSTLIEYITVDALISLPNDPYDYVPAFAKAVYPYALPNLLAQYGMPSRILMRAQGQIEPGAGTQAEVWLFYNDAGFMVQYFFLNVVTQDGEVLRTCPDYSHTVFIRLYLQSPENKTPLEKMFWDPKGYYFNTHLQPIEKITALSIEDFYQLFVAPTESACFEVP